MKQSDILTYAIDGVQMELDQAIDRVRALKLVLVELKGLDSNHAEPLKENNIGRPAEFVANCARCRQRPCICVGM